MGRTSDAKAKILTAARSLMEQRGYATLGVAEICRTAGVPKGSFYYFFESKEALALAVLDEHWAAERQDWQRALGGDCDPLHRLRRLVEATEASQQAGRDNCGVVLGCLFGNLSLEVSTTSGAIRRRLQEIFEDHVDMVDAVLGEARERGEVTVTDTRAAARSLVAQWEGQVLFAKLYDNAGQIGALWPSCLALLGVRDSGLPAGA